ncbi:MAG: glycosyltransferase family 39 protein [Candidatus Alcyoniella australis]|nr:glycosyltransferase family 39 protein [Candidatus Alcyoniella australis]
MAGPSQRRIRLLLILALLAAAGLRLIDLGAPSLWDDEMVTVRYAQHAPGAIVGISAFIDVNPPLYYVLLHYWQAIAGDGEYAWRALSALLGLLLVPLLFVFGRPLVGTRAALIATWIVALSPQHVYSSQEVRSQTALALLALLAGWTLMRMERDGRARLAILAAVLSATALWTHYYMLFMIACWIGYAGLRLLGRAWDRRRIVAGLVYIVLTGLLSLPVLLILLIQLQGGQGWRPQQSLLYVIAGWCLSLTSGLLPWGASMLWGDLGARDAAHGPLMLGAAFAIGAPLMALLLYGVRKLRRPEAPPEAAFLAWWALGPALLVLCACLFTPLFDPRHALIALPPSALLIGLGAVHVLTKPRRGLRLVGAALLVWLGLLACASNVQLRLADACSRQDWRTLVQGVVERAQPGDLMLAQMESATLCLDYYNADRVPLRWIFEWFPRPDAIENNPLAMNAQQREQLIVNAAADALEHERIWLLDYHNRAFDPSNLLERLLLADYVTLASEHRMAGAYRYGMLLLSRRPADVTDALHDRVVFEGFDGPALQLDEGWFAPERWTWAASRACVLLPADRAPGTLTAEVYVPYELLGERPLEIGLRTLEAQTSVIARGPDVLTIELPIAGRPATSMFWACLESERSFVAAQDASGAARSLSVGSIGWQ